MELVKVKSNKWTMLKVNYYMEHKASYNFCGENLNNIKDRLEVGESVEFPVGDCFTLYEIWDNDSWVGEIFVTPADDELPAEIDIAVWVHNHNYTEDALKLFLRDVQNDVGAVVKRDNPYAEKIRKILKKCNFVEYSNVQDYQLVYSVNN